ncbi:unnamed protein product [Camellia sinensis]
MGLSALNDTLKEEIQHLKVLTGQTIPNDGPMMNFLRPVSATPNSSPEAAAAAVAAPVFTASTTPVSAVTTSAATTAAGVALTTIACFNAFSKPEREQFRCQPFIKGLIAE